MSRPPAIPLAGRASWALGRSWPLVLLSRDASHPGAMSAASRPLLILDLDETLIRSADRVLATPRDICVEPYFVYRRPFLSEFLDAVSAWFTLAVWSLAGRP